MNEIIEEWKPIEGYEGLYEVSNLGRVKSLNYNRTKQEKILKQGKMKNGYLYVILCKEGKMKIFYIHRLVATTFIENPNNFRFVNHKDENKTNNLVSNLEWCTHQYNIKYGTCIQRRVSNTDYKAIVEKRKIDYKARTTKIDYKAIAEKQSKKVYQYTKDGELVKVWESTRECGRNGYNQSNVAACCRGELKHYKNYIWSYYPL